MTPYTWSETEEYILQFSKNNDSTWIENNSDWIENNSGWIENNSGIYDFDVRKLIIYITPDNTVPTFNNYIFVKKDRVEKYNKIFDQCEFIKLK